MPNYKKDFPEKEKEARFEKIAYMVEYLKQFELYKFHYFKNSNDTCLIKIRGGSSFKDIKHFIKAYGYKLKSGSELPEFWEATK